MLEEIKTKHARSINAIEVLATKATTLIENSGVLLTLFGVLQIALLRNDHPLWYQVGLVAVFVTYGIMIIILLSVLAPQPYEDGFEATWDGIDAAIRDHTYPRALTQLVADYLHSIENNDALNHRNAVLYKLSTYLFGVIIAAIVALSLFAQR